MAGEIPAFHERSIKDRDAFWSEQAGWSNGTSRSGACSTTAGRRSRSWFVGGETNLCHNALDRHLAARGDQQALVWISTEVDKEASYTYRELHAEVNRCAAMMQSLGVKRGDRVLLYMPMIPEAVFAMLACARIGAIHSVVFGGFASHSLASRIDDARPKVMVRPMRACAAGRSCSTSRCSTRRSGSPNRSPGKVVLVNRGLDPGMNRVAGRDVDWRSCARGTSTRRCRSPGSNRASRPTSSTPRAPPGGRRACSATPAATRCRSRRR